MKDSREAKSPGNSPATWNPIAEEQLRSSSFRTSASGPAATRSPIAEEQLQLARRILEIVREQREALAGKGTVPLEKGTVPLGPKGDCPPRDCPSEVALDRFMALAEERQRCMDRFDRLQAVRAAALAAQGAGGGSEVETREKGARPLFQLAAQPASGGLDVEARQVRAAIEVLFREAAEMDAANRQRLEESRDLVRGEIGRARRGRDVLRSYGGREPGGGGLTSGAFVDRKE